MPRTTVISCSLAALGLAIPATATPAGTAAPAGRTTAQVLEAAKPGDWHAIDPAYTLYMDIPTGRVIIELAPQFAPRHAQNILALVREGYFDGLAIVRSQDNYVVQWGDPRAEDPKAARKPKNGKLSLPPEFTRAAAGLPFTALPDPDTYAAQTGFVGDFPAARDGANGKAWMVHCYGAVGAGRDVATDSGSGAELYAVTGNAPRLLDRDITLVGRVVQGMPLLSVLPRGPAPMGFYDQPSQYVPITRVRVAADLPAAERVPLEALRTDTQTFADLVESRRNRKEEWSKVPAGRIDVCSVPLPVRVRPQAAAR